MAHDQFSVAGSPVDVKVCTKCGEEKPLEEFSPHRGRKDGRQSSCKKCSRLNTRRYRESNPEHIRGIREKHRHAESEKIKTYRATYRANNPHEKWESHYRLRCSRYGILPAVESFTKEDLTAAHGDACVDCGGEWSELDHVLPVIAGGGHSLANCRPICHSCNLRRWHNFKTAALAHYAAHLRATTEGASRC